MRPCLYSKKLAIFLTVSLVVLLLLTGCAISANQSPKVSSIKADTKYVYLKGQAELECIALDPEGDPMTFTWSCTEGTFVGTGPIVIWQAPNAYGDFHIMVVVEDSNGHSSKANITIGVVVNENQECQSCPTRR